MRSLGIDYGEKRMGIAISDALGITAQAVAVIGRGKNLSEDIREIKKIIKKYDGVDEIVVGLPKTMSGKIGEQAEKTLKFVDELKKHFKLDIKTWDERLTTVQAERFLTQVGLTRGQKKASIDKSAASFILQSYLDHKKAEREKENE